MLFAAHETFHIRDGWLHKGMRAIQENPMAFAEQYATDNLGVGKNMVNAIRYWLVACGLAVETKAKIENRLKPKLDLSDFGKLILKYDPFIEEDITLWVIHYLLATNQKRATTWFWLFNKFPMKRFDSQTFVNFLSRWAFQESTKQVSIPSLTKDFNCLTRTYTSPNRKHMRATPEETFECPLSALQLMDYLENTSSFRMNIGNRRIPSAAFGFAVLNFVKSYGREKLWEVGFQDLLSALGSPGRIFLLNSDSLLESLDQLQETYGKRKFAYTRTAGMNLLRIQEQTPESFLRESYESCRGNT